MNNRETLVIMGNGPSLKEIDFDLLRTVDTFGLNAAYRAYKRLNFWPTYFGCFDRVVSVSHMAAFLALMDGNNTIDRFFWIMPFLAHPRATVIDWSRDRARKLATRLEEFHDLGNSGANSVQVGVCLGYKRFILVGVDGRYNEKLPGMEIDGNIVTVKRTPKTNPNYWFDDYQRAGDKFNVPRADVFQRPGWELLAELGKTAGIEILNCSPGTALECFPIVPLEAALDPGQNWLKNGIPEDAPDHSKLEDEPDFERWNPTSENLEEIDKELEEPAGKIDGTICPLAELDEKDRLLVMSPDSENDPLGIKDNAETNSDS